MNRTVISIPSDLHAELSSELARRQRAYKRKTTRQDAATDAIADWIKRSRSQRLEYTRGRKIHG